MSGLVEPVFASNSCATDDDWPFLMMR